MVVTLFKFRASNGIPAGETDFISLVMLMSLKGGLAKMHDASKRALLIEAVIASGLIAIGIPTGQLPLLTLAAAATSVGCNWTHSLAERGFQHWCDGWLTEDGVLNHDIEKALCQAYIKAVKQLEQDWKPHYEWLQRKDKAEAEATVYALHRLREEGANLLLQPKQLTQQEQHARALSFLYQDNAKADKYLKQALREYLNGYNEAFITFVAERLGPQWILRFAEILKDPDNKEGTRAWRACQLLWQKNLMSSIGQMQEKTDEIADTVRWLQEWARQLKSQPIEQRNPIGRSALEDLLHSVHDQLDEMQNTLDKTYTTTLDIQARLDFDGLNELRIEIARLAAVQKVVPSPPADVELHVRGLLEAMGYRINDAGSLGTDLYFLCDIKSGAKISQELVHYVDRQPTVDDIVQLDEALVRQNAKEGILLTRESLLPAVSDVAHEHSRIQCYTLSEFIDFLADFRPYLQRMIEHHEAGEIPQFYVPLSIQSEPDGEQALPDFRLLEPFIDTWLTEPERNHLSIMGDFGSGKTWFCKYYSYLAAKRYLSDPTRNRIPILITLRDYSRASDVEQLITDVIVNHFKIGLAAGYKTFAQLNEAGRLLLIFDGFDEMERRISDYRTTVDNFWELAKVVSPGSKVILTCRTAYFRHRSEERDTLILRHGQVSMKAGDQVIDLRNRKGFELIRLLDFTDEDIQLALQKRIPRDWLPVYKKIQALPNLRDLASRPVLLDMIIKTLPQIHAADQTNQATLYETYVDTLLQRREGNDTDFIPPQGRLYFVEELAWEMYQSGKLTIPFSEFPERVMKHFHLQNDPERAAFFERDVRTQSYLVRDNDGNYRFGHKSFLEFFVARKLAGAISGSGYDITRVIEVWKSRPLTYEAGDFLVHMVADCAPLWQMIEATRNKTMVDVGYAGGNAATLLQLRGESFAQKNLSHTVLAGADLHHSDMTRTDLRGASLRLANLSGCTLVQTDVRKADLTNVRIEEMGAVEAVMFDPSGEVVASGSADGIVRLWKWTTAEQVGRFLGGTHVTSTRFSPDGQFILAGVGHHGHDGSIKMWYRVNAELVGLFVGHTGPVWDISFCPGQRRFASSAHDGSVRIWDVDTHTQVGIIHKRERGIWEICYSPDGTYIAVAGGAELEIYDAQAGTLVWVAPEKAVEFRSVKYSNTNLLAYTTREGQIFMRDAIDKKFICGMKGTQPGPNSIAFSPDGQWLAIGCGGTEATIQIWDTHSGTLKTDIGAGVEGHVGKIHWSLQNYLVGGFSDGTVRIWDVDSSRSTFRRCLMRLETRTQCQGMRIGDVSGLDTPAPDGRGNLRNWFISRGARV